jgi:hypothetical protein
MQAQWVPSFQGTPCCTTVEPALKTAAVLTQESAPGQIQREFYSIPKRG